MTEVSIIIVSYNAGADLSRCLESLTSSRPRAIHEIIVVDNASTDDSVRLARQFSGVRVIQSPSNRGFAAANNIGIRASTGQLILLLNSDTVVPPGAIDQLIAELVQHADVAAVGPRLVDEAGHAELSFGAMMNPFNELRQRRLMRGLAAGDAGVRARVEAMTRGRQYPDWVSGACLLVRRGDAEAVGLLDERYFLYTEDVDFCAALRARGRRILFTPSVQVVHRRGRSAASAPQATRAAYQRSHLAFYRKHYPVLAPLVGLYRRLRPL